LISFFDDIKIVFNKENFLHCYRLFWKINIFK
jgi:hypothetical protein